MRPDAPHAVTAPIAITDHALLRWMEREHGIDINTWRKLMHDQVKRSLQAFDGRLVNVGPAFILSKDCGVIKYISEGLRIMRGDRDGVVIRAVGNE